MTAHSSVFSALAPYGWDDAWADAFAPYDAEGLLAGRVVRVDRGQCDVVTADGTMRADTAFVTPHDPLRVVCTGDWVAVEPSGNPRYILANRLRDAVALRHVQFANRRSLAAYQQLRAAARAAGCWQAEREQALVLLRADAGQRQQPWYGGPVLVDALLDDGDVDAAWQAAAETRGHDRQWLALADQARAVRPADALGVYLRLAEPLMKQTGSAVYEQLTSLLLSMRDCHHRLDTEAEFTAYLAALRAGQKRKRNLMRLLDQHGL